MRAQRTFILSLILALFTVPAAAAPLVYVVNGLQFGTVDLNGGAFQQLGPDTPEGETGLVPGPHGSLLTLTFSGNLDSIDPATGVVSVIGATGLADCTTPASPCGPTSANTLGSLAGRTYATDFANNLYTVNTLTGAASLIGATGIPGIPFIPAATNPDGSFNIYDEALFSTGGQLYATFDAGTFNPATAMVNLAVAPSLYRIDVATGLATRIGPTTASIGAVFESNGALFAFNLAASEVMNLDVATGNTTFVSNFDPAAGIIVGAVPAAVPEPASLLLFAVGLTTAGRRLRKKMRS